MSSVSLPFAIPKTITRKVQWLRWLVRGYVALEGIAAVAITAGLAFWIALFLDWSFEPNAAIRVVMWGVAILAIGYVAWRQFFSRVFARLSDTNMALLLERSFPQINESLVTTMQAAHSRFAISPQQGELLANTSNQASHRLAQVPLGRVFRYQPLLWKLLAAITLSGSLVGFATLRAEAYNFWLQRAALSAELWPRKVQLTVAGFEEVEGERTMNVARDDDFELKVLASLLEKHVAPEQVEIRYELADGRRGRDMLTQIGAAVVEQDDAQQFRYEFKNLSADITFDVIGGDDRIRDLRLHVVERPQIVRTALAVEFPQYLGWSPQSLPFTGRVEVPYGSQAICQAEVNKPLQDVRIYDPATKEDISAQLSSDKPRQFSFPLTTIKEDRVLLVDLRDTDGVLNREPYRLMIALVADELPEVAVQLRGIGAAVTPQATIPLVGTIVDDHGVAEAWIDGQIDKQEPHRRPLTNIADTSRENVELGRYDLAAIDPQSQERLLVLQPGQQITLSAKARDAYDLDTEPHVGSSQRFVLDIVTDSQLRALLEKRELGLRQRFEALHEKMMSTRDLVTRIELQSKGDDGQSLSAEEIAQRRERDKLRVVGVLQNVTQLSYETLGVAEGFEDIVVELENNRIDTEELTQRLGRDIAEPLRVVATELMPELEQRVQKIPDALDNPAENAKVLAGAIIQSDEVVAAMQRILDRMLELESYNEIVELLRGIVGDQQQLNEETKAERREKLRSLLDEE